MSDSYLGGMSRRGLLRLGGAAAITSFGAALLWVCRSRRGRSPSRDRCRRRIASRSAS